MNTPNHFASTAYSVYLVCVCVESTLLTERPLPCAQIATVFAAWQRYVGMLRVLLRLVLQPCASVPDSLDATCESAGMVRLG